MSKEILHERDIQRVEIGGGMHSKFRYVVYAKDGTPHHVGQLKDALDAVDSGFYLAKPPAPAKGSKRRIKLQ